MDLLPHILTHFRVSTNVWGSMDMCNNYSSGEVQVPHKPSLPVDIMNQIQRLHWSNILHDTTENMKLKKLEINIPCVPNDRTGISTPQYIQKWDDHFVVLDSRMPVNNVFLV
jgi:hypothetical protein